MADADVICLQEVARNFDTLAGSRGEDQFALLAAAFPGYTAIEGVAVDVPHEAGGRRQFGNLLLSRLPLRQAWRHLLPWPADAAHADMQRVAIEAVIEAPDVGDLRVTTTHLAYYSAAQRLAQFNALRELHAAAQGPSPAARARRHLARALSLAPAAGRRHRHRRLQLRARLARPCTHAGAVRRCHAGLSRRLARSRTPASRMPHTVGLYDTVQWPRRFACDFVFVSADLAPRVTAFEVDAGSDASDHQALLLTLD